PLTLSLSCHLPHRDLHSFPTRRSSDLHMGVDASPRPGFDSWISVPGQGKYIDPEFNVDGKRIEAKGYVTDLFNEKAVAFIRQKQDRKSTRLNSSHRTISYAVFCLKKKK